MTPQQWARKMLHADTDALILDTETTGLHDGEIVQIAVIDMDGNTILDTFVKPVLAIPSGATAVHGITAELVADAPVWATVSQQLQYLLRDQNVVIYNAVYDRKMMHKSAEHAGLPKVEWKELALFHCAMERYAEFYGEWNDYHGNYKWQSLSNACAQCRIDTDAINAPVHSALGDCLRTLAVIKHMAREQQNG